MNKALKEFDIVFSGLKLGSHFFDFEINDAFFSHFDLVEFQEANLIGKIHLIKQNHMLELTFSIEGTVEVHCDVTDQPFRMPLNQEFKLVVKFGDAFNDDDDEILILPQGAYSVFVARYFYELAVLSLPLKRIHPDVAAGKIGHETLELIEDLHPEAENEDETQTPDPRWEGLKKFLNDN
jgi:uncharacterized metal-binding protein YceD (DUF177 family)